MPKGTENIHRKVKDNLDLRSTLETLGLEFKKTGSFYKAYCPFHQEKTPSFTIKEGENYFKCYGCGQSGDIFNFLELHEKLDSSAALRRAAEMAGVQLPYKTSLDKLSTKDLIFLETAKYYHNIALDNGGKDYFITQRRHFPNTLEKMQVGFADGGLLGHLRAKGFKDTEIFDSGLARKREGKKNNRTFISDFFAKGMAIFPHFGRGKVLHFSAKWPDKKLNPYQIPANFRSKSWRFYNQDALSLYNEIIVVEGEHDLLSLLDTGTNNVIGIVGQVAESQIRMLKSHCVEKDLYLWFDKDEAGRGYVRKVCASLKGLDCSVSIIEHPGETKDPDDYLKSFAGDRRKEVERLQQQAQDYLAWELTQIAGLADFEKRLTALRDYKIFAAIDEKGESERLIYIDKLKKMGFTDEAIRQELESNRPLKQDLEAYFECLNSKRDADPNAIADIIFQYFNRHGKFFKEFKDESCTVSLLYRQEIYTLDNNIPFNALMKEHTGLLPTKEPGRSVWESLRSEAFNKSIKIEMSSWLYSDRNTNTIYINLNSPNNTILRISPKGIDEIPNGLNNDNILLKTSNIMKPFSYLPDCDIREGMDALHELVFKNMTCEEEQRYLILCWAISLFLFDYSVSHAILKFSGSAGCGKTTVARLLSVLFYGNGYVGQPTAAAAFSLTTRNPLLVIDNLENDSISKVMQDFLLQSATGGGKDKRKTGTESGITRETLRSLVIVTAIEPFPKFELIDRTLDIEFSKKFKNEDFTEDEIVRELLDKRNLILSSILKFIQKNIMPNLSKRNDYRVILNKEYKSHAKSRMDQFLSILMVILEKVLNYIPLYGPDHFADGIDTGEKEIRDRWVRYQDEKSEDTEVGSSSILKILNGLVRDYRYEMNRREILPDHRPGYDKEVIVFCHPEYGLEMIKTKPETHEDTSGEPYTLETIEFIADSGDIVSVFDKYCGNHRIKNPYSTSSIFAHRLKNDIGLLGKGGWELVSKKGKEPYFKVTRGRRFWKFVHTLIR